MTEWTEQKSRREKRRQMRRRFFGVALILLGCIFAGAAVGAIAGYLKGAPSLAEVEFRPKLTTYLYDVDGRPLSTIATEERRVKVLLEQIPLDLQNAIIAVEDDNFRNHHGISVTGILRAVLRNLRREQGRNLQGGSTITQQLARNAFLTLEQTWSRKLKEVLWTIQIERRYSKDEILEAYLNEIYFGHGRYGVEAASQYFFGKSVKDLTLAECALLAGVPNGPGYYSPFIDLEASINRRNLVLRRMVEEGYITQEEANRAKEEPVVLAQHKGREERAGWFVDYVKKQALELPNIDEEKLLYGGLKIYTTLDPEIQAAAEEALNNGLPEGVVDDQGRQQPQGAIVAIEPSSGEIRAMVGGREYVRGKDVFNRATMAYRQPGSALKPFIYTVALEKGLTPATVFVDEPTKFILPTGETWEPSNYHGDFAGPLTLRDALEISDNIVAVKLLEQVGVKNTVDLAQKMGITSLVTTGRRNDLSLAPIALGGLTKGVTPLEMAAAYAVYANGGIKVEPVAIRKIVDANGEVLYESRPKKEVVLSEAVSYLITDMMRGVIERGTGKQAYIGRPAAGKTGTAQNWSNGWFIGYTPDLVASVWMGNDTQSEEMIYNGIKYGSWTAAAIWGNFMKKALANVPIRDFQRPANIVDGILIDTKTGLLAKENRGIPTNEMRYEMFIAGTEPTEVSPRVRVTFYERMLEFFGGGNRSQEKGR